MSEEVLFIKINVPSINASKLMKFEANNTIEEVINRIRKTLVINDAAQCGLYLPAQESIPGSMPAGMWLSGTTILGKYKLVSKQTVLEYKNKRASEPMPVRQASTTSINRNNPAPTVSTGTASIKEEKGLIRQILSRFFETRPSQEVLIQNKILQNEVHSEVPIPLRGDVVERLIQFIEQKGMNQEGIYRISGLQFELRLLERSFEKENFDLNWVNNVHTATGALKLYFREMVPPLIPYDNFNQFIEAIELRDEKTRMEAVRRAVSVLPPLHRKCFESLLRHLLKISQNQSVNKMSPQNLAIVVAPTLMRPRLERDAITIVMENEKKCKIIDLILNNFDTVFTNDPLPPASTPSPIPTSNNGSLSGSFVSGMSTSSSPQNRVAPPQHFEIQDDEFGYFSDIVELSITGNHIEKLQAAKELSELFLDETNLKFETYLKEIMTTEQLTRVITRMAATLSMFVK